MALTNTSNPSSIEASGGSEDEETAAAADVEGDERVGEAVVSEEAEDPLREADEDVEDAERWLESTGDEAVEDAVVEPDESVEASCFLEGRRRGGHSRGSRWEGSEVSSPVEAGSRC